MFNLTGKRYSDGMVTREITRQTNYGVTVEIVSDRVNPNKKYPPQDYSWEQLVSMTFGPMITEEEDGRE